MKIIVPIKQVPDTATRIRIRPDALGIESEGVTYIISPYDEFALEESLRIKEKLAQGEVVVITLGPAKAKEALRSALAMGADRAVHLIDPAFEAGDPMANARALAAAIKTMPFDLIFCGRQAIDDDSAQVGPMLAEFLGLPQVCLVMKVELAPDRKTATVHRQIEGALEVIEVPLPAVLTAQKGLNEPRYPSLKGIMGAKKKEIKDVSLADLGLPAAQVGLAGSHVRIAQMILPPPRPAGKVIEGADVQEKVRTLVKLLREEAKAI